MLFTYLDRPAIMVTARVTLFYIYCRLPNLLNSGVVAVLASHWHAKPINLCCKTGSTVVIKSNQMMNVPCPSVHVCLTASFFVTLRVCCSHSVGLQWEAIPQHWACSLLAIKFWRESPNCLPSLSTGTMMTVIKALILFESCCVNAFVLFILCASIGIICLLLSNAGWCTHLLNTSHL